MSNARAAYVHADDQRLAFLILMPTGSQTECTVEHRSQPEARYPLHAWATRLNPHPVVVGDEHSKAYTVRSAETVQRMPPVGGWGGLTRPLRLLTRYGGGPSLHPIGDRSRNVGRNVLRLHNEPAIRFLFAGDDPTHRP